jgi:hypothetical protein
MQLETFKVSVFKECTSLSGTTLFEWYRAAHEHERLQTGNHLVIDEYITEAELWERLQYE